MASRDMMFPQQINEWARECATDSDNWYDGWMSQVRRLHGIEPDARLALQQTAGILKSVEDRQNPQLNLQFVPIPRFPPNLSPLAHLQHISIAGGGLQSLPESIDTLQDLRSMNLSRNPLRALPDSLANLANLNTLLIVGSPLLTALPDNLVRRDATGALQGLVNLEALTLIDTGLTALPRSVMRMSKLKTLTLSKSPIEDLPNDIDRLRQLQTLQLDSTPIAWIRPSVAQLPQLRNLSLRNCRELRSLPENIGDLQALRFLDLTGCYRLQTLPPSLAHLRPDCEIRVPPRLQAELHLLRAPAPSVTLVNPAVQARLEQIDSASQWMMDLVMSDEKNPFLHGCPPFLPAPATGDPRMTLGDIPAVRTMLTESGYMEKRNALEHNSSMRNFQTDTPLNVASLGAAVTMWRAREMAIARNPSLVEIFPHLPVDLPPNLQCPDVPRPPLALPNPQEQVTLD
ncbi:hypothetical protein DFQ15_10675 [Xylophilus ampelinus]|uniref:Type III effector Xcv3220-like C-terminal domain-containing protein n=2 Tax=Xylophilus ampelinus TaxID=54067 RepID=A0A318SNP3_9BURK|nr:hypothetical protein DFQ15_10675 [Xylophilus ampelinus]